MRSGRPRRSIPSPAAPVRHARPPAASTPPSARRRRPPLLDRRGRHEPACSPPSAAARLLRLDHRGDLPLDQRRRDEVRRDPRHRTALPLRRGHPRARRSVERRLPLVPFGAQVRRRVDSGRTDAGWLSASTRRSAGLGSFCATPRTAGTVRGLAGSAVAAADLTSSRRDHSLPGLQGRRTSIRPVPQRGAACRPPPRPRPPLQFISKIVPQVALDERRRDPLHVSPSSDAQSPRRLARTRAARLVSSLAILPTVTSSVLTATPRPGSTGPAKDLARYPCNDYLLMSLR